MLTVLPERGMELTSVHISLTFSRIRLQCRSKAFTRPKSLWLFLQFMRTCNCNAKDVSRALKSDTNTKLAPSQKVLSAPTPEQRSMSY